MEFPLRLFWWLLSLTVITVVCLLPGIGCSRSILRGSAPGSSNCNGSVSDEAVEGVSNNGRLLPSTLVIPFRTTCGVSAVRKLSR